MTYLIDTNVISELRKGTRCNVNLARWYSAVDQDEIYLSVLVLGEIRMGIERVRPGDPAKARALEKWFQEICEAFEFRILGVDAEVADVWGRMCAMRTVPAVDSLMAAIAQVHRKTLVTRNVKDVSGLGAEVFNPFAP
ncbi:MAG: type II toxin-antitoxin system VapC family toxin [Variibacter sp.]|nr:type II toxin-antitoxin system VapC family toxin [Variibacter sp.]